MAFCIVSGKICSFTFHIHFSFHVWNVSHNMSILVLFTPCTLYYIVLLQKLYSFSPETLCFNNLQHFYRRLIPLGPLPSFLLQERIPSINSSFYLVFNPSCILGLFTEARNKLSGSALKWACVQGRPYVCARAHTFLHSQANTHASSVSDCMCRFFSSSPKSLKRLHLYLASLNCTSKNWLKW